MKAIIKSVKRSDESRHNNSWCNYSETINQTLKIGRVIAKSLRGGDVICLFGQLGAGKTVLTKGIAAGLGIKSRDIISPSFVLVRQYNLAKIPLYHIDLYRLKSPGDILSLGYEDYLYGNGVTIIEWADRLKHLLPREYLKIELIIKDESRRLLIFNPAGKRFKELSDKIYENIRH